MFSSTLLFVCCVAVSGIVEELSVSAASQCGLHKGDPVMALVGGGGYAGEKSALLH